MCQWSWLAIKVRHSRKCDVHSIAYFSVQYSLICPGSCTLTQYVISKRVFHYAPQCFGQISSQASKIHGITYHSTHNLAGFHCKPPTRIALPVNCHLRGVRWPPLLNARGKYGPESRSMEQGFRRRDKTTILGNNRPSSLYFLVELISTTHRLPVVHPR